MFTSIKSKLSGRQWALTVAGILCLNLLILGLNYHRFFQPTVELSNEDLPAYDFQFKSLPVELIRELRPDWRLLLLSVINAENPDPKIHYMDVLYRKHHDRGLEVVGVYKGTAQQGEYIKQQLDLTFPVINDPKQALQQALRIDASHPHGGVLIIDADSRVRFSAFMTPKEDELRILVEKYLLGEIDYAYYQPKPYEFFRPGQKPPALELQSLNSKRTLFLEGQEITGKNLALFLANCASCEIARYMKQLADFEKSEAAFDKDLIAVFADNFSSDELASYVELHGIRAPVYIMRGDMGQLQDEYATRYLMGSGGPLLVSLDGTGTVRSVGPLFKVEE